MSSRTGGKAGHNVSYIFIGSGCHCARAPTYTPGPHRTAGTDNSPSTERPTSLQSAIAPAPETYPSPSRQSSYPLTELSAGIRPGEYGSTSDYSRPSSSGPLHQTSHFRSTQSPPGLKTHRSMSSDGDAAAPPDRVSENGNSGPLTGSGTRAQYRNGYMVTGASKGNGFIDPAPEVSKIRFSEVTANTPSHSVHDFTDGHSERQQYINESKCCCGTSNEHNVDRGVDRSTGSGAPSASVDVTNRRSSMHHTGTKLSNNMKEPHSETSYSHVLPPFHVPHMPYTNVYNMPSTYATAENPLTQRQQAFFQQNGYMHPQLVSYYPPLGAIGPSAVSTSASGITHTCTCGPSCQCVFCLAHPYNATTRDRVQTLAHLLPDDPEYSPKSPAQSSFFHSIEGSPRAVTGSNAMQINEILQPSDLIQPMPFHGPSFSNGSYETLPTESVHQAPQSAISSGYLTMEYEYHPIGLRECPDSTGTCQCGDGCSCVGCLTHSGHDGEHF